MASGGFDIAIGNPPYVNATKVRKQYQVKGFATAACPDIYAWCLERSATLLQPSGRTGMIVPLSLGFSGDFQSLRDALFSNYQANWFASFGRIPSALFNYDVRVRNTIHLAARTSLTRASHTTLLHRWFDDAREYLFQSMSYAAFAPDVWDRKIPKFNTSRLAAAFEQNINSSPRVREVLSKREAKGGALCFKKTAYNWLAFSKNPAPCQDAGGNEISQTQLDELYPVDSLTSDILFLLLNGKLAFIYWCALGDDFHVTKGTMGDFPFRLDFSDYLDMEVIKGLCKELRNAMKSAIQFKLNAGINVGTYNLAICREVTDRSDALLAGALSLSEVWEDIELYYSQVVRTDFSSDKTDD